MSVKTLHANGTITVTPFAPAGSVTVVGSAPVLADNHDSTYVHGDPAPGQYNVGLQTLTSYDTGDPIALHIRLSIESDDHTGEETRIYIFLQDGHPDDDSGDFYVAQFTDGAWNHAVALTPPFDGTIHDLVLPLRVRPGHFIDDCVAVLESGTAQMAVNTLTVLDAPWDLLNARVYEAWVEVGVAPPVLIADPKRLYPRADGRGVGTGRQWPHDRVAS